MVSRPFFQSYGTFYGNKEIRYVIGAVDLDKVLKNEKDKSKFHEVLSILIDKKQKELFHYLKRTL